MNHCVCDQVTDCNMKLTGKFLESKKPQQLLRIIIHSTFLTERFSGMSYRQQYFVVGRAEGLPLWHRLLCC